MFISTLPFSIVNLVLIRDVISELKLVKRGKFNIDKILVTFFILDKSVTNLDKFLRLLSEKISLDTMPTIILLLVGYFKDISLK